MKIRVRKQDDMWKGWCYAVGCTAKWQFWFFGATLGYGLEHMRRHAAERRQR